MLTIVTKRTFNCTVKYHNYYNHGSTVLSIAPDCCLCGGNTGCQRLPFLDQSPELYAEVPARQRVQCHRWQVLPKFVQRSQLCPAQPAGQLWWRQVALWQQEHWIYGQLLRQCQVQQLREMRYGSQHQTSQVRALLRTRAPATQPI